MGLINWILIDKARTEAAQARADAARLQATLEELALATKALQRTLVEKGVCSSDEFAKTLREIDLEDGVADGRRRVR